MNILLNFYPVQSGGGQQVASNFLKIIEKTNYGHNWFFFLGKHSELDVLAKELFSDDNILSLPYSYKGRITNQNKINQFVKMKSIGIIYNYAPVLPVKGIKQVVRSVYSNLYFPEVNFWEDYPLRQRVRKNIIDYLRLSGTLKANGLIFENESMQERASELFNYPANKTTYIHPSVSHFEETKTEKKYNFLDSIEEFKVLYLSSWHLNKKIDILPKVAALLRKENIKVRFILSLDKDNRDVQHYLLPKIDEFNVQSYFEFIGSVNAMHVHQVVKASNSMILLSKLECFSSNVVEAFYFERPLLISDEPWARAACKSSAAYVKRDDPVDISAKISEILKNNKFSEKLKEEGKKRLMEFNTPESKVQKQVEFLEYIYGID